MVEEAMKAQVVKILEHSWKRIDEELDIFLFFFSCVAMDCWLMLDFIS